MLRKPICPEILAMLYERGETLKNMATRFDCGLNTISRRADELGLKHPNSPRKKQKQMHAKFRQLNALDRYRNGESLMELAAAGNTSVEVVQRYLKRNGVKPRTRCEQVAATMEKYGTRFHKKETRLYTYERDAHGLVTKIKVYQNKSRKPVELHIAL